MHHSRKCKVECTTEKREAFQKEHLMLQHFVRQYLVMVHIYVTSDVARNYVCVVFASNRQKKMLFSQSKSSVNDKLHELHSHFPLIAQRTPSIITSSCWKSTVSDIMASGIDRKKGRVQNVSCLLALTSEIYMITKRKNMLMCLYLKIRYHDFNIKIYCICFFRYKSPLFWTHIHFWLTGQTNLWRSEHASFSINTGCRDVSNGTFSTTWCNYRGSSLSNWGKMGM